MAIIRLQENQNLFDLSIQQYGSIEGLFDLLKANEITEIASVNEEDKISVYKDLSVEGSIIQRDIVEYYISREKKPATAVTIKDLALLIHTESDEEVYEKCIETKIYNIRNTGIGCMRVGEDNMVF